MVKRLQEDHEHARLLADGLRRLPGLKLDRDEVQTNIFFVTLTADTLTPAQFTAALRTNGVLVSTPRGGGRTFRMVTHYGITRDDIQTAITAAEQALSGAVEGAVPSPVSAY
jgi:threonine aldolase